MSDRWERRYTLHLPSGVILDAYRDPPDFPERVEDIPDSEWRELGTIDRVTGLGQVDWTLANRWRSLAVLRPW